MACEKFGNASRVAEQLKVKPAHISQWKNKKHRVPLHTVEALSRLVIEDKYPAAEETVLMDDRAANGKRGRGAMDRRSLMRSAVELVQMFTAPIIAFAQGGEGAYPEDLGDNVPRIAVPCKDPNCYVLELQGNSMEPVYLEGDLLVVAPNMEPMNNDLVILRTTDDEVLFKKFKHPKRGEEFQFLSFNPHHPALNLRPDQIFKVSVVHSVIRPLKEKWRAMATDPLSKIV